MTTFTLEQLNAVLYPACALTVRPFGLANMLRADFYLAWFPSGVLKAGLSERPETRMAGLPSDARNRGVLPSTDEHPRLLAVIPKGGKRIERAMLYALQCEQVSGEYFRGPLASAVAAALISASVPS